MLKQVSVNEKSDGDSSNDDALEGSEDFLSSDFSADEDEVSCTPNAKLRLTKGVNDQVNNRTRHVEAYNSA